MTKGRVPAENVEERMRELRKQGLSLQKIATTTGYSIGKVQSVVKDVPMTMGLYQKKLPAGLVQGTIINLETTGLDPPGNDIITCGFLEHNIITVIQRIEANPTEFYDIISEKLSNLVHPIYAYDARFHEAFLLAKLHIPIELTDIFEPWRDKARTKGLSYPSLDDLASVPREYFGEIVVPEREVRSLWASYAKTQDKRKLSLIVRHCMEDLRQALYVMTFMGESFSE